MSPSCMIAVDSITSGTFSHRPLFDLFSLLPSTVLETKSLYRYQSRSLGMDLKGHETFLASPFLKSTCITKADTFLLKDKRLIKDCMHIKLAGRERRITILDGVFIK